MAIKAKSFHISQNSFPFLRYWYNVVELYIKETVIVVYFPCKRIGRPAGEIKGIITMGTFTSLSLYNVSLFTQPKVSTCAVLIINFAIFVSKSFENHQNNLL